MPKGKAIHIGLNSVDVNHYAWDGALNACEFDAKDMQKITKSLGYETQLLLTADATRDNVINAITDAGKFLSADDILVITYSGHGGSIIDTSDDEEDGRDETWCLYDGQLIDDELYALWTTMPAGLRIVVISDSCHSGTVIKSLLSKAVGNRKCMPIDICEKAYKKNKVFYLNIFDGLCDFFFKLIKKSQEDKIDEDLGALKCTVRLLSGCQDNQYSMDGEFNGAFTGVLKEVFDTGFDGNYSEFYNEILSRMPDTQSPNHLLIGAVNEKFSSESPFAI